MANTIKFVQLTQAQYDASTLTKVNSTLYFTSDTHRIYKGSVFFSNQIVTTAKTKAQLEADDTVVLNRLYVNASTQSMFIATALKGTGEKNTIVQIGLSATDKANLDKLVTIVGTPAASKIVTTDASSNFAYSYSTVTSVGATGDDTNLPTQKAVRSAIEAKVATVAADADQIATVNASGNVVGSNFKVGGTTSLNGTSTSTVAVEKAVQNAITSAVQALDVDAVGGTGKAITTISETNGKISATAIDLTASNVARSSTSAIVATTVQGALLEIKNGIDTTKKQYKIKKLTAAQVTALGDANVKQAYKAQVKTGTGDFVDDSASDIVKIYKDQAIIQIYVGTSRDKINTTTGVITKQTPQTGQALSLNYAYWKADGTADMAKIPISSFLHEAEFKDGLKVVSGKVYVKIDEDSQVGASSTNLLSVSSDGVKIQGVVTTIQQQINKKVADSVKADNNDKVAYINGGKLSASTKTFGSSSLSASPDTNTLATQLAVKNAVDALNVVPPTAADADQLATVNASGKFEASNKKIGGQSLAASPDANTVATQKAVKAAVDGLNVVAPTTSDEGQIAIVNAAGKFEASNIKVGASTLANSNSTVARENAVYAAINALNIVPPTVADADQIATVNASGKFEASGKKIGGSTLASTPDANTIATEEAVSSAISASQSSLTASKGVKRSSDDFQLDYAQTGSIVTGTSSSAYIADLDGNTLKFNNTAVQNAIDYALTWQQL